jgi:hypothetical protein
VNDPGSVMQIDDAYEIPEWARNVVEYLKNEQLLNDKKSSSKNPDVVSTIYSHW